MARYLAHQTACVLLLKTSGRDSVAHSWSHECVAAWTCASRHCPEYADAGPIQSEAVAAMNLVPSAAVGRPPLATTAPLRIRAVDLSTDAEREAFCGGPYAAVWCPPLVRLSSLRLRSNQTASATDRHPFRCRD